MTACDVTGVAVRGPGLSDWTQAAPVLRGDSGYRHYDTRVEPPAMLSARERRRASTGVRLALDVAARAVDEAGLDPATLDALFAAAHGESVTTHKLLDALSAPEPTISPTQFHNSVHNTPAGYWAISTGSHAPCDSIAAGDWTVGAALLKAAGFLHCEARPILVVVYDTPFPEPLNSLCPLNQPFAAALVLAPAGARNARCRLETVLTSRSNIEESTPGISALRGLYRQNPAARILPLLEAVARGGEGRVHLSCGREQMLSLGVAA